MNKLNLLNKLPANKATRFIGRSVQLAKKHSPAALTVIGGAGLVATAYLSYKAAPRVNEITDEMEDQRLLIEEYDRVWTKGVRNMTDDEIKWVREVQLENEANGLPSRPVFNRYEYLRQLAGAVALPVATGVASLVCIAFSYKIMNGRIKGLTGALSSVVAKSIEYDKKVKANTTEEQYKAITGPVTKGDIEITDEDGNKKVVEGVVEKRKSSSCGVWLSDSEEFVKDDHDYNLQWLYTCEAVLTSKLKRRDFLYLNEVFDELGIPRTKEGAVLGWDYSDPFGFGLDVYDNWDEKDHTGYKDIYINWVQPRYIYEDTSFSI